MASTCSGVPPIMAAMAPLPGATACCMLSARYCMISKASFRGMEPAKASAAYSPSENPATPSGAMPWAFSAMAAARSAASTQGWVLWVRFRSSCAPSKHRSEMPRPSALSAASNTSRAAGCAAQRSFIMPGN